MTDAEYEAEDKRVKALVSKWSDRLGLNQWHIAVRCERDSQLVDDRNGQDAVAECMADWRYLNGHLTFYARTTEDLSDDELEECVIHELLHCLVNEMREKTGQHDHEERVVTGLTWAIIWTRDTILQENASSPVVE